MRIGPLRNRITIQQLTTQSAGSFGGSKEVWTDVKTVYAQMSQINSAESFEAKQTVHGTMLEFRIRQPQGFSVDATMRIVFRSINYYIVGIVPANAGDHYILRAVNKDNG